MDAKKDLDTPNLFRLDGKVAIITGAGGLLGEQHAIALSDFGATVVLTDLRHRYYSRTRQGAYCANWKPQPGARL